MTIDLKHPIVASMMARPAKFTDDNEMKTVIGELYGGRLADGMDAAMSLVVKFVKDYKGAFPYVRNCKREAVELGLVPPSKLRGLLNTLRGEALAQRDGRSFSPAKFSHTPKEEVVQTNLDFSDVDPGDYAFTYNQSAGPIMFHVEHPGPASKWHGWVFVSGGMDEVTFRSVSKMSRPRLGSQKPGELMKVTIADVGIRNAFMEWGARVTGNMTPLTKTAPAVAPTSLKHICKVCGIGMGTAAAMKDHMAYAHVQRSKSEVDREREMEAAAFEVVAEVIVEVEPEVSIRDRVRQRYHLDNS